MGIDAQHPLYQEIYPDYIQMFDTIKGERAVKAKGETYLPATAGMHADGMQSSTQPGYMAYQAYKTRAVYHDILPDAIEGLLGMMHRQEARIKLPAGMEDMRTNATSEGESLQQLMMKMNKAQLEYGRFGLLAEVPDGKGPEALPFISTYSAMRIINWDTGQVEQGKQNLELVVLDESEFERGNSLEWNSEKKYRVLAMSSVIEGLGSDDQSAPASGRYVVATVNDNTSDFPTAGMFKEVSIAGKSFDAIPFVFVNTKDIVPEPAQPPLLGLSNLCLAIYRGEADYRQALFFQGQETLVTIGSLELDAEGKPLRTGAGAVVHMPLGGDAKYIGAEGKGLGEMRQSLENDKTAATQRGARLLTAKGGDRQSGEALRVRVAAQTATLTIMAKTGAFALEQLLKQIARLKGFNEEEVKVEPNLDFADDEFTGRDLLELMQSKMIGAPISNQSVHELLKERGMTKLDYETEMTLIDEEGPIMLPTRGDGAESGGLGGANNQEE